MLTSRELDRVYRRRLAASAALVLGLQALVWSRLPRTATHLPALPAEVPAGAAPLAWVELGAFVRDEPPASGAPVAVVPEPEPAPQAPAAAEIAAQAPPPPMPSVAAEGPASSPAATGGSTAGSDSGPGSGSEVGSGAGAVLPGTVGLQPRVLVMHRTPKVVEKRRIDAAVQLEARVGTDGRVLEVRVVRHIPDCEECTASAVEAAMQYVYDPSIVPAGASDVWIGPIGIGFRYRK